MLSSISHMRASVVAAFIFFVLSTPAWAIHGWDSHHWAHTVAPIKVDVGDCTMLHTEVGNSIADWDRSQILSGSQLLACSSTEAEYNASDVALDVTWSGRASISYDASNHITGGKVEFNKPSGMTARDRQIVATHEDGHMRGLDHDFDNCTSVMSYCFSPSTIVANTHDIEQVDIQHHLSSLDSYSTLKGAQQAAASPTTTTTTEPTTTTTTSYEYLQPNSMVQVSGWSTDTGYSVASVLRDGVYYPNLPDNTKHYTTAIKARNKYEVRMDDQKSTATHFTGSCFIHIDQYGTKTRTDYSVFTIRSGAKTRIGFLNDVTGRVDGTTTSAWKEIKFGTITATEVKALTVMGFIDVAERRVYNQAAYCKITPATTASLDTYIAGHDHGSHAAHDHLRFGEIRRVNAHTQLVGLGVGETRIEHVDTIQGAIPAVNPRTGLFAGVVDYADAQDKPGVRVHGSKPDHAGSQGFGRR